MNSSVSVIIPVFNIESAILEACVKSVIDQTLSPDEVIIVFDGSPVDQTIIDKYFEPGKIKILHKLVNQGVNFARRDGFLASSGQYIVFMDADDILEKDFLSIHLSTIMKYNATVSISKTRRFHGTLKDDSPVIDENAGLSIGGKYDAVKDFITGLAPFEDTPVMVMWGKMYRRRAVDGIDWSIGNYRHGEDYFSGIQIASNTTSIVYIDNYLYNYRKNRIGKLTNKPKYNVDPKGKQIPNSGYVDSLMELYSDIADKNCFDLTSEINDAEQTLRQYWIDKESRS